LYASDIYITPYLNEAQITSGTLSYAVGVGAAVMSTPYWHAVELLAEGRGKLFNFNDSDSLASTIDATSGSSLRSVRKMKKKALDFGRRITWPKTGEKYVKVW
jgi:hypothetical protein